MFEKSKCLLGFILALGIGLFGLSSVSHPLVDDVRDAATIVSFSGLHCVVCIMLDLRLS